MIGFDCNIDSGGQHDSRQHTAANKRVIKRSFFVMVCPPF